MTTSITTTTASTTAVTSTTAATTTSPVSTGLSSVSSSIASSAPATSQGCSAQLSAWIASVVDSIRSCLAKLPLIGSWFEHSAPSSTSTSTAGTTSTSAGTTAWTDAELVNMIRGQFVPAPSSSSSGATVAVPAADVVNYTLNLFGQIGSPVAKMEAFEAVLSAVNSTDDIARQFYNALPVGTDGLVEASRNSFKAHIWEANGRNDAGQGLGYGDHVIANAIRTPLTITAAQNLRAALVAGASSTSGASSTTGASSSTGATTV